MKTNFNPFLPCGPKSSKPPSARRLASDDFNRIRFRIYFRANQISIYRHNKSWGDWRQPPYDTPLALWAEIKDGVFRRIQYQFP